MIGEKVKFAVLGCGRVGKRHLEMIKRHPEAELVAAADIKPKDELGLDEADLPVYNSLEDLLASDHFFDVINICTP